MATTIDTLSTYEAIAATGIADDAARVIIKAIDQSRRDSEAGLATKHDLQTLVTKLDTDFARMSAKSDHEFALLRAEIKAAIADVGKQVADSKTEALKALFGTTALVGGVCAVLSALGTYAANNILPGLVH